MDIGAEARDVSAPQHVIRPLRQLFHQGIITFLALTTPVFAVLYWMSIQNGQWPMVLAVHVLVMVIAGLVMLGYLGASVQVSPAGIRERGFFGRVRTSSIADVASILILEMYRDSALDTQPQLFVCDREGRVLLRMRGMFWSRADMDEVIDQLDVAIEVADGTFTVSDLRRTRPELLYWFERIPRLAAFWIRARA